MDVLHVADGSKVADIGAGAGWFTIHLARRVGPNGVVYSQDVQREMLEAIKRRVQREGLQNVQTTRGEGSNPNLPVAGLDAIVVVDAYQEVEDRVTFLQNLARALKPNGLIGVVNWKPGRGGPGPPENARVDKASVTAALRGCGSWTKRRCRTSTCWFWRSRSRGLGYNSRAWQRPHRPHSFMRSPRVAHPLRRREESGSRRCSSSRS